ncbi:MAG: hypothetical protein JSU63_01780 [Phycisphaerales bacterium]|nr:MAG: hypothetical protein JSU63_01780 [Phycisphaerales bacterium]
MPADLPQILQTAQDGFSAQESELAASRSRQVFSVISKTATGSADIDEAFQLDCRFRLVFVRCHFSGSDGTASLTVSIDSAAGAVYDTRLFTIAKAGTNRDVNLRISREEGAEPSPWTFQAGDAVRVQWTNPDTSNITWGLEVGLAIAS